MPLFSAERTLYRLTCPSCRKTSEHLVARLIGKTRTTCRNVGCRKVIDLKTPYHRALIQKLADHCADLDALTAKRDQLT